MGRPEDGEPTEKELEDVVKELEDDMPDDDLDDDDDE